MEEYQALARRTMKQQVRSEALQEAVMGLCGEAGECIDLVKKAKYHGHSLSEEHLIKEAGDALWYVAELAAALGVSLDDIARQNIDKLKARYPEGFSSERSIVRKEGDV